MMMVMLRRVRRVRRVKRVKRGLEGWRARAVGRGRWVRGWRWL